MMEFYQPLKQSVYLQRASTKKKTLHFTLVVCLYAIRFSQQKKNTDSLPNNIKLWVCVMDR